MSTEVVDVYPLQLFVGDEPLRVKQAEEAVLGAAFEGESPGFNLAVFQADSANSALDQARTQPMLARRRAVVIREMEKAPVALLQALLDYAENPNPSTVLILCGSKLPGPSGGVDRGRRLFNKVKSDGRAERYRSRDQRPAAFVEEHARRLGVELDSGAAFLLVQLVGSDLGMLQNEVDKLATHIGGQGRIMRSHIETVCSLVAEAVVWELTDAIIARDPDRGLCAAFRMLENSGTGGDASHRLLAMISWQVRQLLRLQTAIRSGEDVPAEWRRVPRRKLEMARKELTKRPLDPARIFGAISHANHQLNRSKAGSRRVFESLVLTLTT
jgi:DNA polymerase-3 subunit delta